MRTEAGPNYQTDATIRALHLLHPFTIVTDRTMAHRSFPPSHLAPPPVSPALLRMIRPTPAVSPVVQSAPQSNPRVQVFPSADGTVLLIGVTLERKWVAEYRCLADDFDDRCVSAMERRVRLKERIQIVR